MSSEYISNSTLPYVHIDAKTQRKRAYLKYKQNTG